jgi:murein DD-endopeptidase MepM/ murein hydrolase activator NlpD
MELYLLENQHVARRQPPSYTARKKTSVNKAGFVQQIKQHPAIRPGHTRSTGTFFQFTASLPAAFKDTVARTRPEGKGRGQESYKQRQEPKYPAETPKQGAGFSFSVPSLPTMAVIAGTILFSALALNWDGITVFLPSAAAPQPKSDAVDLAGYAIPQVSGEIENISSPAPQDEAAETLAVVEEEIPLDLLEGFRWSSYQVKKGDSVSKIAAAFSLSMDAVIASNEISNARRLPEGKILRIPNMDGIPYIVKKGDSISKISKSMGVPLNAILDANDIRSNDIQTGETLFIPGARLAPEALKRALGELMVYPVRGRLTSGFGWRNDPISGVRRYHAAIDLAAGMGTPVKAVMDGAVSVVGYNPTFGKFVIVSHYGGYQSMYAHLSAAPVKQGDRVIQGGKIGEVGNTGYTTGPHLHFAVYRNGRALNPLDLIH